ncbi:MAG: C-terminal peptidase (prc), partial [Acidobacteria bacterium]|nr:C-terminal peptidase (prc) [Acidobacteriota bacterium]
MLLTIRRPGLDATFDVEITRARIPQDSVRFAFMLRPGVGYIRLTEFTSTSVREVGTAMNTLRDQGMTDLIFDLRDNPGGQLDAAVGIANFFLREGQLIVST